MQNVGMVSSSASVVPVSEGLSVLFACSSLKVCLSIFFSFFSYTHILSFSHAQTINPFLSLSLSLCVHSHIHPRSYFSMLMTFLLFHIPSQGVNACLKWTCSWPCHNYDLSPTPKLSSRHPAGHRWPLLSHWCLRAVLFQKRSMFAVHHESRRGSSICFRLLLLSHVLARLSHVAGLRRRGLHRGHITVRLRNSWRHKNIIWDQTHRPPCPRATDDSRKNTAPLRNHHAIARPYYNFFLVFVCFGHSLLLIFSCLFLTPVFTHDWYKAQSQKSVKGFQQKYFQQFGKNRRFLFPNRNESYLTQAV